MAQSQSVQGKLVRLVGSEHGERREIKEAWKDHKVMVTKDMEIFKGDQPTSPLLLSPKPASDKAPYFILCAVCFKDWFPEKEIKEKIYWILEL